MIITACIPAVNANLDRIVGYYGLFFIPLGAFIILDIWVFPKIGLISDFTSKMKLAFSWPSALAWIGTLLVSFFLQGKDNYNWLSNALDGKLPDWLDSIKLDVMYLAAPAWVVAALLYLIFSYIQQKRSKNIQLIKEGGLS